MRLWSIHPRYLDPQGLVALWREGLLAQKVLAGKTRGYRHHPQLERFRAARNPMAAIGAYLEGVAREARVRDYCFDESKILHPGPRRTKMAVTRGQVQYEWEHLLKKLRVRSPDRARALKDEKRLQPHPLFRVVAGKPAAWERPLSPQ